MEAKTYEMGNVVLKVKESQVKAHKCPYLSCDKAFFKKSELYNHLMLGHGEIVERTKPKLKFSKTFKLEDLEQIQIMINRQRLKKYAMLIGELFEPKKPNLNKSTKKQKPEQKPQEEAKEKPKKKSIFAIIIEVLKKNRDRNAGRSTKA